MVDLAATLEQFQDALTKGHISPIKCSLHQDLYVLHDAADNLARITYARILDGQAKALVAFIPVEPYNDLPCLNVGLAVAPSYRRKGLGTRVFIEALGELEHFLTTGGVPRYYVEGVASIHNTASNTICKRLLSDQRNAPLINRQARRRINMLRNFRRPSAC